MLELRELTGSGRSFAWPPDGAVRSIGRLPGADLPLDPRADDVVSVSHAQVQWSGGAWWIQDLDSRNGTWVNGSRVSGRIRLSRGDRITLGQNGPSFEVRNVGTTAASGSRRTWVLGLGVAGLVLAAAVVWGLGRIMAGSALPAERTAPDPLEARVDSLLQESRAREAALASELAGTTSELEDVRDQLMAAESARAAGPGGDDEAYRRRLEQTERALLEAQAELGRLRLAPSIDAEAIGLRLSPRSALVVARTQAGPVAGSAIALDDSTLVTAAHVVEDAIEGEVAVQFASSVETIRGRVREVATEHDLALVHVPRGNRTLPALSLNLRPDTLAAGAPVTLLGYPLGGTGRELTERPRPLVLVGVTAGLGPAGLEVDSYGRPGASGSPVFDADGALLGILYGAAGPEQPDRIFVVPSTAVEDLLGGAGQTQPSS